MVDSYTNKVTPNQDTENMEVHHHPDLHHKPKKWKEYFLEFLMIFLAVTMGFFAENIREGIANKEKEKKYMQSMLADLRKDTAEIAQITSLQKSLVRKMDSALSIPTEKLHNIDVQDTFYHHFVYFYGWNWFFTRYDNTLVQLKNAGGFSILKNQPVIEAISNLNLLYDRDLNFIAEHFYVPRWQKLDEFAMQLISLPEIPLDNNDPIYNTYLPHKEILLRYDRASLEQLYSFIRLEKADIVIIEYWEEQYRNKAANLIELIQKEYSLEN
ncbi:MAG TPA: hypothetical protein VGM30_19865 [Puia sp.]|jgi:hypothetical protein